MNGWEYILIWVGFLFVSVASSQLAVVFPKIKLPLITGYLFIGIAAGPYVLDFLTKEDLPKLAPVNQFVLAFIGFSAGAELFLPELRDLFKTIFVTVGAISVLTFALVTAIMRGLLSSNVGSFVEEGTPTPGDTSGVAKVSSACMVGIAMLVASIMTARSPASAIAIAKELRAKGPFTRAFLGVTVVSDVVVLVLFAISAAFARGQCTGEGFSGESVLTLVASLVIAVVLGYFGLGKLIVFLLYLKPNIKLPPKWLILPIGFGIFKLNEAIADATLEHIGHEVGIEPLLMTIVAGYVATNQSRNRRMFLSMLQKVGPYVFIPFFTLTGASLDLRVFVRSALLAVIIAIVRVVAIFGGSIIGGVLAKAPKEHTKYMWLSLITQAGVSLGLAGEINFMFPDWGPACATAVVGVIMLNQIVGPILCKIAIKKVHEHGKAKASDDEEGGRTALILGINGYSLALAHRLRSTHWRVVMADYEESKLGHALRLNGADHDEDPHDQSVDSRAIQKKKKVFYGLKEEKSPQPPQGTIINASAGDITPSDPSDPSETPDQPPPLPTAESLHTSNAPPPPITNEGAFSIVQKKPPPPAEHNEHEPVIYDVNAKLIKQEEKSELALEGEGADVGIQWNYKELSAGMDLKKDVIICMLDTEAVNILACGYFKDKLKFGRVIGAVHAPTSVDMYIKAGAYPVYSFSSSIDVLYQCVTAKRPNAAALRHMISFESENYPSNLELLPHLLPPDLSHDEIEDIRATHEAMAPVNLIDIDLIDNSGPVGQDIPLQPAHPVERLRNVVRDGFSMTGQRLRELPGQLRDPIGLVNRSVQQMNVVPDSQRDEYLDSIAALHDTQPVTTNPIWLDLLGSPNTDRRMESQFTSDQPQLHGTFRTDRSVFEEYQGMDNNSNLNPNPNPNASSSNFASFFLPSKKP